MHLLGSEKETLSFFQRGAAKQARSQFFTFKN
jgi:hypothetical protein